MEGELCRGGALLGAAVVAALRRLGFERRSQAGERGSHVKMKHADGRAAIAPLHGTRGARAQDRQIQSQKCLRSQMPHALVTHASCTTKIRGK
jgi:predicted RNA binding protein YcfA (HicA-like mRNA interferase family)